MQKLMAWTQLVTAIAALATAILVGYYSHQQIDIYNRQLDTYRGQLATSEAATLANVFRETTGAAGYHRELEAAQRLTFDVAAADALEAHPGRNALVNTAAIHALSTELDARLVEHLLTAAQQFITEKTTYCSYSQDELKRIRREFLATYLLVHPAAGGEKSLDDPWKVEKSKHFNGPPGAHRDAFKQFADLVDQITTPCTAPATTNK